MGIRFFYINFISLVKNCNHKRLGIYYLLSAFIFGISGTLISVLMRIELYSSGSRVIAHENVHFYSIVFSWALTLIFLVMGVYSTRYRFYILYFSYLKMLKTKTLRIVVTTQWLLVFAQYLFFLFLSAFNLYFWSNKHFSWSLDLVFLFNFFFAVVGLHLYFFFCEAWSNTVLLSHAAVSLVGLTLLSLVFYAHTFPYRLQH